MNHALDECGGIPRLMMDGLAAENSLGHIALALVAARYIFWEHAELENAASNDAFLMVSWRIFDSIFPGYKNT